MKNLLRCPDCSNSRSQFLLACLMLTFGLLFLVIFINVVLHGPLTHWNGAVYYFFRSRRALWLDKIAVVIVSFGYYKMLSVVVAALIVWLVLRRQRLAAIHWFIAWMCVLGSIFALRFFYFSSRPWGLLRAPFTSSFPSGHVTGSIVFYFLFAFMFTQNLSKIVRKIIYLLVFIFCMIIACARLYLGLHWLTDVLAGVCLGGAILLFIIISYRRYRSPRISLSGILIVALVTLCFSNAWFLHKNYAVHLHNYQISTDTF